MISDFPLTRISPQGVEAIHFYYDVTPESPDGSKVVYFEFAGQDLTRGQVAVADRDGSNRRLLAEVDGADTHSAVRAQWIDDQTVAYCRGGPGGLRTMLLPLAGGSAREMPGALRMLSPTAPLGLTCRHDFAALAQPYDDCVCLMDMSAGTLQELFTLGQAMAKHPLGTDFPGCQELTFMHTKWAPDGAHFFVMASNGHRVAGKPQCKVVHAVFVADADGGNLRYVTEEYHHPMWGSDPATGKSLICYFQRREDGTGQDLMAFDPEDGRRRTLVEKMRGKHACVTRRGERIVTDVIHWPQKQQGSLVIYQPGSGEGQTIVVLEQPDFSQRGCHQHPTWSRDERRVYFNTSEPGYRSVWAVDVGKA